MGLSNYLPSSRISQSGVCTSTTRPASPYEGQMIYETDTNRVLVYNASAWVMIADTDAPPGLELVKAQTIGSAVSSVTVSGVFSSEYNNYKIVISDVTLSVPSANTVNLRMYDGTNVATTNYNWAMVRIDIAATTVAGSTGALTDRMAIGVGTGDKFGTAIDVLMPFISTHTIIPFTSGIQVSTGYAYTGAAMHQTTASYSGLNVFPNSGTMTGGTIRVYGYRNS